MKSHGRNAINPNKRHRRTHLSILPPLLLGIALITPAVAQTQSKTEFPPTIVFGDDDRVPSQDPRVGRIEPIGCTGFLISNGAVLTAGHCFWQKTERNCLQPNSKYLQFNVPLSSSTGKVNNPVNLGRDQYNIDPSTVECANEWPSTGGVSDWAVFSVQPNALGELPAIRQKGFFRMTIMAIAQPTRSPPQSTAVRVTGYGADGPPPTFDSGNKFSYTEQTATGSYLGRFEVNGHYNERYKVDTLGGNSGSPVIVNGTTLILGIHDGAENTGYNLATSFASPTLAAAIHGHPGKPFNIPGNRIFYVDKGVPNVAETGKILSPYKDLGAGLKAAAKAGGKALLSVVSGNYPGTIDNQTATIKNIIVALNNDVTLQMPVGGATLWAPAENPN